MLVLGLRKRILARSLANPVLAGEAKFSLVDAALAPTVLAEGIEGVRAEGS